MASMPASWKMARARHAWMRRSSSGGVEICQAPALGRALELVAHVELPFLEGAPPTGEPGSVPPVFAVDVERAGGCRARLFRYL